MMMLGIPLERMRRFRKFRNIVDIDERQPAQIQISQFSFPISLFAAMNRAIDLGFQINAQFLKIRIKQDELDYDRPRNQQNKQTNRYYTKLPGGFFHGNPPLIIISKHISSISEFLTNYNHYAFFGSFLDTSKIPIHNFSNSYIF